MEVRVLRVICGAKTASIGCARSSRMLRNGPMPIPQPAAALTRREDEVAQLVSRALSNKEIARELRLSESTVKHHVHSILGKFGLSTRGQLIRDMRRDAWAQESPARSHG